ncbi:MAG: DASH family cryptochrome [Bacteroidota bacterium]
MSNKKTNSLIWFRNNLRIEDNQALYNAVQNSSKLIGYINIDPNNLIETEHGFRKMEKYRAKFLLESVENLKNNLNKLNISLIVDFQTLEKSLKYVIDKYSVQSIYLQKEWTRDEKDEERKIPNNINTYRYFDQFLYSPERVKTIYDNIPRGFSNFRKKCEKYLDVESITPIPNKMDQNNVLDEEFEIPTLRDLGFEEFEIHESSVFKFLGGETSGKNRIEEYFFKSRNISNYKNTRNGLIGKDYSSKFSPWLANGSISARFIYYKLNEYEKTIDKNDSTYWLFFELIWRDFFKYVSMQHKNKFFSKDGIYGNNKEWSLDKKNFRDWMNGKTSEPFVNANMIELSKTGFMSNRGRQNVANFLTKELKIDWRIGAEYFEAMLIDYDVHSNYGNWLYNAGIGNDSMPFRKFNPTLQSDRYDPNKNYENLWLND